MAGRFGAACRRAGIAAGAAALAGCTTIATTPMSDALATQLRGQEVAIVTLPPSTFSVVLTHAVALGPLGIPEMVAEGQRVLKEDHIVDPADAIATMLGDAMAGQHGAVVLTPHAASPRDEPAAIVAAAAPGARYVLAVGTVSWGVGNLPMPRSNYFVSYVARARLIDARTKTVVAEAGCMQPQDGSEFNGAWADLSADNGRLIKTELAARADRCVHFLRRDLLGL